MAAAANPDWGRKVLWKAHPDMNPNKVDEQDTVANDLAKIPALLTISPTRPN